MAEGLRAIPRRWWGKCAAAGLIGGVAMGLYLMMAIALSGKGAWLPINSIGATIPAFKPPDPSIPPVGSFMLGPSLSGLAIHLVASTLWGLFYGVIIAAFVPRRARAFGWETLYGLGFGAFLWFFFGLYFTRLINPTMVMQMLGSAHYFIGHLLYGVITAWTLAGLTRMQELAVTFAPEEAPVYRRTPR